jgi:sialic acid synthase SpsE
MFIIAEAGVNHNGDVTVAHDLIDAAVENGADAVKFQTFDPETLDPPGARRDMLRGLVLTPKEHLDLKRHCDEAKIEFMSTPFDVDSLTFLVEEVGVRNIKIASGNLDNWPLLDAAAKSNVPLYISTGMSNLRVIKDAANHLYPCLRPIVWMHCVSEYPCPAAHANLLAIEAMYMGLYKPRVGFSDHTTSTVIPAVAVAFGVVAIEKHLTLDVDMDGPDHRSSLEPDEFAKMVLNIREAELALGDGEKKVQDCEREAVKVMKERREWRERSF